MSLMNEMTIRSNAFGLIGINKVVDAVNSLPEGGMREAMIAALKEREPKVRWLVSADGRLDAV